MERSHKVGIHCCMIDLKLLLFVKMFSYSAHIQQRKQWRSLTTSFTFLGCSNGAKVEACSKFAEPFVACLNIAKLGSGDFDDAQMQARGQFVVGVVYR